MSKIDNPQDQIEFQRRWETQGVLAPLTSFIAPILGLASQSGAAALAALGYLADFLSRRRVEERLSALYEGIREQLDEDRSGSLASKRRSRVLKLKRLSLLPFFRQSECRGWTRSGDLVACLAQNSLARTPTGNARQSLFETSKR